MRFGEEMRTCYPYKAGREGPQIDVRVHHERVFRQRKPLQEGSRVLFLRPVHDE